ncbi:hypothetical protein D3C87_1734230 [compost metagenome]
MNVSGPTRSSNSSTIPWLRKSSTEVLRGGLAVTLRIRLFRPDDSVPIIMLFLFRTALIEPITVSFWDMSF